MELSKTSTPSVLRGKVSEESSDSKAFQLDSLIAELHEKAPLFLSLLNTVTKNDPSRTAVAAAILLKARNAHLSEFHHTVGQILDLGGATDEVYHVHLYTIIIKIHKNSIITVH